MHYNTSVGYKEIIKICKLLLSKIVNLEIFLTIISKII
jgi:hypothetical protein